MPLLRLLERPAHGGRRDLRPGRGCLGAIPTNDDLTCIIFGRRFSAFHELRADVEGGFLRTFAAEAPGFAERVHAGRRETRFVGTADLPNFYRRPYGPGWALVGDAGYHKDPCPAQGITDAFRDAGLLSAAIHAGFSQRRPLPEALAEYERLRNQSSRPMFEFTKTMAANEPPTPEMQRVFAALRDDPHQTSRFFGVIAGTVPVPDFFAPRNLATIGRSPRPSGTTAAATPA